MSSNSGIFGLSGFNDKNLEGSIPDKTRESYREFGYFGGGDVSLSSVERADYSNDTILPQIRGSLLTVSRRSGASGNTNFAYYAAGNVGGAASNPFGDSRIHRVNYSNDAISSRGNFPRGHFRDAATGNINYGYFGGGEVYLALNLSLVDRIDYSNDLANALVRGPLSSARSYLSATGNSNFGYFAGGSGGTLPAMRINYANDTTVGTIRGILNSPMSSAGSTGNNNFGYFCGGISTILERIDYSNDTQTSTRRFLTGQKNSTKATGNSNFGYFSGGIIPGTPNTLLSLIERIDYSNDSATASIRGPMSTERYVHAATSSHNFGGSPISQYGVFAKPFGYFGGGRTPGVVSTIDRIDYSNDTSSATIRNSFTSVKSASTATGNSNFGYFGGGTTGSLSLISTVDRVDYTTDNQNPLIRGSLTVSIYDPGSAGNSNFGYFCGGGTGSAPLTKISTINRISYSNDTATASVRGPLSSVRYNFKGTGTFNFGYFGGGVPGSTSIVDRINYSNDSATTLVRSSLSSTKNSLAATGNSNFGYFGGGVVPGLTSTIDRIDYSNDTATASPRGPLSLAKYSLTATGNSNFGYFGGGESPGFVSTIDRVDYANDTAAVSVRSPLTSARGYIAATSPTAFGGATDFQPTQTFFDIQSMKRIEDTTNESVKKRVLGSYGYFGGGFPGPTSTVDRIDYSNDTATASARGSLSVGRRYLGATGNSNFGYYGGGEIDALNRLSTIDRIDYSNDSSNVSVRSFLAAASYRIGFGNQFYGYFAHNGGRTEVSRVDFSNDTNVLEKTILYRTAYYRSSTGNNDYGYINEGLNISVSPHTITSLIERVQYSNDNQRSLIRGPLNVARRNVGATGNSNFGYFAGGLNTSVPAIYSSIERVNYSNDTVTASVRGVFSITKNGMGATGNQNFGYFGGGGGSSLINRLNYSNDTETAQGRSALSSIRTLLAASTNAQNS